MVRKPVAIAIAALVSGILSVAVTPAVHAAPTAAVAKKEVVRHYKLTTGMADGKMVYLDAQGKANPVLKAEAGETVEITVSSGEGGQHDIAIPDLKAASAKFDKSTGPVTLRFKVDQPGRFAYLCTIPGHRQIGMEGVLEVTGSGPVAAVPARNAAPVAATGSERAKVALAIGDAVSIALDPRAVPAPLGKRAPQFVKYRIETVELEGRLDDGTTFTYWTFDKKVPGPMLRVKQGDTVELTLANAANSKMVHSIDLHAVTGGHGGAEHTQVAPGQEKTVRFKALSPGLYVYHCATPLVPHHISAGMYGMILVEPPAGLPRVDRELYVMQGDIYTKHAYGTKGHQDFDVDKMADERPDYYVFNGAVGSLTKEHKLTAKVGETVRIFFGVGGPNKISSFHVIGEIFDKVYPEGSTSTQNRDVQTTLVAPGGATIAEVKFDYPGTYMLVDHALSRVGKGLAGAIQVTGEKNPDIYRPMQGDPARDH